MRRTSSRARRTVDFASSRSSRWSGAAPAIESSCNSTPVKHLPDLVVQIASDPNSLRFLSRQHAPPALLALTLEPVEHLVERMDHAPDLVIARNAQTLAGTQQVDHVHSFR